MVTQDYSERSVSVLARVAPYACLVLVVVATVLLLLADMQGQVLKSLYLSIPVAAGCLIAIIRPGLFRNSYAGLVSSLELSNVAFRNLALLFGLFYAGSLLALMSSDVRPPSYFILTGVLYVILFVELFASGGKHASRRAFFIFQVALLAANLIFGQTLRLPYYFGWGDSIVHMDFIASIVESGHVTSAMADYQYFPGFHIYDAAATLLGGMSVQSTYFIVNGLVFLVSIPAVYLLVTRLTTNRYIALTSVLMFVLSREVLFNGMYMITRVMAFIFCLVLLALLVRSRRSLRLRALALLLVLPLVFIHHTTLAHFSIILALLVMLELFLARSSWSIGMTFTLFFTFIYLGYWLWIETPLFTGALRNMMQLSEVDRVASGSLEMPVGTFFLNAIDHGIIAFLSILGIFAMLRMKKQILVAGIVFSVFGFVAFITYFPGFTDMISQTFLSYRWRLLVAPFIVFIAAGGLIFLVHRSMEGNSFRDWARIGAGGMIVFLLAVSSTLLLGQTTDLNLTRYLGEQNRHYFEESELVAFDIASGYRGDTVLFTDYHSSRYVENRFKYPVRRSPEVLEPDVAASGSLLYRQGEFDDRGELTFCLGWAGGTDLMYYYRTEDEIDLQGRWEQEEKLLDTGTVILYRKNPGD